MENRAAAYSGMTFAALPPFVMIPCTRASGRSCWRIALTLLKSCSTPSSALIPRSGCEAACADLPLNSTITRFDASEWRPASDRPEVGWIIIAASTSSNPPARMSATLPPPPSSAGVPIAASLPGSCSITARTPTDAATPIIAMRLCPQACPISARASYSWRIATDGPGLRPFALPRYEVSMFL